MKLTAFSELKKTKVFEGPKELEKLRESKGFKRAEEFKESKELILITNRFDLVEKLKSVE